MKKIIVCIIAAVSLLINSVSAEVLGTITGGWSQDMGFNTYLNNTTFESNQSSVGKQTEYYVEYTPNDNLIPVVINGESLWGTRTITQAMSYMTDNGLKPLIGINADYFSFKTGIPMGTSVMNGEITTSSSGYIDAIGFRQDGTGFITGLNMQSTVSFHGVSRNIECINKWYTPDYTPIAVLTDKFGNSTKTSSDCLFLICSPTGGSFSIGESLTLNVDDKFEYNGEISIPDGKYVVVINKTGNKGDYEFLDNIPIGASIDITNTAVDDREDIWHDVYNAIGTSAGRLLKNGEVGSGFEEGSAPRTAIGVKPDGKIIFYVLDGRQQGYSYGAKAQTIAQRLKELGCVDALNLDGGGSTSMAGIFPGSSEYSVINQPSDGSLRSCANYIFLRTMGVPTGILNMVKTENEENKNFMSGTSTKMNITEMYDTNGYRMDNLGNGTIDVVNIGDGKSYIDDDRVVHFDGAGIVWVNVMSEGKGIYSEQYECFDKPDYVKFYDQSSWKEISEIYFDNDTKTINIAAAPYIGNMEINSNDSVFNWSVVGNIGTIDENGIFTLSDTGDKAGKIVIEKNGFYQEINVYRSDYNGETETGFDDIKGHWAQETIISMVEEGILNGYEENGKRIFKPDAYMTRAEFSKMICSFMGLDAADYALVKMNFSDSDQIPPWAQNSIKAMYENGIIKGRTNDDGKEEFAPYDNITRAEAMTVLGRISDSNKKEELAFADNADIPQWAQESMEKLLAMGIIKGYNDNTILPNSKIKRAEAATMLYKMNL